MKEYKLHPLSVGTIGGPKKLVTHLVDDSTYCDRNKRIPAKFASFFEE